MGRLPSVVLLLVFWLKPTLTSCPLKCNCTDNSINCISKSLESVPYLEILTNNPLIIDLSGNDISNIDVDDFSFDKSEQVKEIYLNNSKVVNIEPNSFDELTNLQELYLGYNLLNSLPVDFIANNEILIVLDISGNYFTEIPNLKSKNLELLVAANSKIETIGPHSLENLTNLRVLYLQQNMLKEIDPQIFNFLPETLHYVDLNSNPWNCDCHTVSLFDNLTSRELVEVTNPVECLQQPSFSFKKIYTEYGAVQEYKECSEDQIIETDIDYEFILKNIPNRPTIFEDFDQDSQIEVIHLFYASLIFTSIFVSLVLGAIFGSCVTYKHLTKQMRTESTKVLLTRSVENLC